MSGDAETSHLRLKPIPLIVTAALGFAIPIAAAWLTSLAARLAWTPLPRWGVVFGVRP